MPRTQLLKRAVVVLTLLATSLVGVAVTATPAFAGTVSGGWAAPLGSMASPADGFLADGCGHANNYQSGQFHIGADYWGSSGDPVYSIGYGVVKSVASFGTGNGYVVMVEYTAPSDGAVFVVVYGHLNSAGRPTVNQTVNAGYQIGTLDPSVPAGAHLHLGIHPGAYGSMPSSNWGNMSCPASWPPSNTNGFVDPLPYLGAHAATGGSTNAGDLAFVNKNYYGGQAQVIAYSASSSFGTLSQLATTGLASTTDANTIPMFKPNGDLAFVNTNYSGGNVQVLAYGASSSFGTLVQNVTAGMGSYSDPHTIPMFKPNGDLAFVNMNYYLGNVQVLTYSASSNYATLVQNVTAGFGSTTDPYIHPMFRPNGDLVFVNTNYYAGNVQVLAYSASSNYSTLVQNVTAGLGSYTDPYTIPMFKPNGDLAFVNENYYGGNVQVLAYSSSSNYGTLVQNTTAGIGSYTDPYTIPMFKP
jgi:hypothetical protein